MRPLSAFDAVRLRGLHLVARAALRLAAPPRALRLVHFFSWLACPLRDTTDARAAQDVLHGAGSCLTRSVTIASRLQGSEIVIGAEMRSSRLAPHAHAWVELGAERLDDGGSDLAFNEIARLSVNPP